MHATSSSPFSLCINLPSPWHLWHPSLVYSPSLLTWIFFSSFHLLMYYVMYLFTVCLEFCLCSWSRESTSIKQEFLSALFIFVFLTCRIFFSICWINKIDSFLLKYTHNITKGAHYGGFLMYLLDSPELHSLKCPFLYVFMIMNSKPEASGRFSGQSVAAPLL